MGTSRAEAHLNFVIAKWTLMGSGGDIKDRENTWEKNCFQVLSYSQKNIFKYKH